VLHSSITSYGYILSFLVLICIVASLMEFGYSSQSQGYARNVSIYTLLLSAVWNCILFICHLVGTTQGFNMRLPLFFPTMSIFFYINIFQMQLFIYIWRSKKAETMTTEGLYEDKATSLFIYNGKIYLLILLGTFLVFNLLSIPELLLVYLSVLWIPQIIHNMLSSQSKAPSIFYILSVTAQYLYVPVLFFLIHSFISLLLTITSLNSNPIMLLDIAYWEL